jgi:hypothetical protein
LTWAIHTVFHWGSSFSHGAASPGDPAMAGFGAGVHHYLNMLLTQMDAKTTTLLVATLILTSLLLAALSTPC